VQLFILSTNIEENAAWYMDSHVLRLPMELQHLLMLACVRGGIKYPAIKGWNGMPVIPDRKKINHPIVKWASLDEANFMLVKRMSIQLCHEYQLRFGNLHNYLGNLLMFPDFINATVPLWSRFPLMVPMFMRNQEKDVVEIYRSYYVECKHHLARWHAPRSRPPWFPEAAVEEGKKIAKAYQSARRENSEVEIDGVRLGQANIPEGLNNGN
jgi:hypothetical protein